MLLPIKPICPVKKMRRDGTAPIFIQYCYSATNRTLLNTGITIPPQYWNTKQLCISEKLPANYGNHEYLNEELTRLKRIAEDLITYAIKKQLPDKGSFVKKSFSPTLQLTSVEDRASTVVKQKVVEQKGKLDIYHQLDEYIKSKEKKVTKATLCVQECQSAPACI